jgi:hypothetical protein
VVSLDGTLIAIPSAIASAPETIKVGEKEFFAVPSGKLTVTLSTQIEALLTGADVICAFDQLKDSIREEEAKREK